MPTPKHPNVTHLKDAIDRGVTGDKAPGFDPAAAPLGTDDEAGGASLATQDVQQALYIETRTPNRETPNGASRETTPSGAQATNAVPFLLGGVGVAILIFAGVLISMS